MTDSNQSATSIRLNEKDRSMLIKAKRILESKGMRITIADAFRAALYFFVEHKEKETAESVKPTHK